MSNKGDRERDLSTERLFAMGRNPDKRLKDQDERAAQGAPEHEELSLQNIFIEKSANADLHGGDGEGVVVADAARPARESRPVDERSADAGLHARFGTGDADVLASVDPAPVIEEDDVWLADTSMPVLLTAVDLLPDRAHRIADLSDLRVDPASGTVFDNGDSTWTFRPAADFAGGPLAVKFFMSGDGVTTEVETEVDVVVETPAADPVVRENTPASVGQVDLGATAEDTAITFSAEELLAQASDIDGDALAVTAVSVDEAAGSISDNGDGSWTFQPAENFNGEDVPLQFTVSDGSEQVAGSASLDVTAVNDGPRVGAVDLGATAEDTAITFSAEELLAQASDIDGDALSIVGVSVDSTHGEITDNGNGTYTFNPADNVSGADIPLQFTVSDGTDTAIGSATLDVVAKPEGIDVTGTSGNDTLVGSEGDDILHGGRGNDTLSGLGGDDTFTIRGNEGLDQVDGGEGHDTIKGSRYGDTIQVSDGMANIQSVETIDGGDGYDVLQAGSGNDTLDLSNGPELVNIEEIDGGRGDDTIIGTAGNDNIEGNAGNDTLAGGAGDDALDGGSGSDTLVLQGTWDEYTITRNDDASYTIEDSVQGRDGTDTAIDFEHVAFADGTVAVEDLMQAPVAEARTAQSLSGEDLMFFMGESGGAGVSGGWSEQVESGILETGPDVGAEWGADAAGAPAESDVAAGALDLAPDTGGVISMTEGTDTDGLAGLQETSQL